MRAGEILRRGRFDGAMCLVGKQKGQCLQFAREAGPIFMGDLVKVTGSLWSI